MLVDEGVQTSDYLEKKFAERRMVEAGRKMWNKQQEEARYMKMRDQRQAHEMMEKYWPWGHHHANKPRGLRNLRLEGLFPQRDYDQAKRFVGTLDMGRPGGGAPNVNESGKRTVRTKEDPLLRFQWSKDLRQNVDNSLRYKTNRKEQEAYKRELDKLVEEKSRQKERERMENLKKDGELLLVSSPWGKPGPGGKLWRHHSRIGFEFFKSLGYTNGREKNKIYEEFKRTTLRPPNQITKNERLLYPRKYLYDQDFTTKGVVAAAARRTQLSPLHKEGKENGVELVPLMVEKRANLKIPLGTTDVTRQGYTTKAPKWVVEGPELLHELTSQIKNKRQHLHELKVMERDRAERHFNTWDTFWGRPGHGAPRSGLKKGCIQKMLYPKFIPIGVA